MSETTELIHSIPVDSLIKVISVPVYQAYTFMQAHPVYINALVQKEVLTNH